jgi:hypothetical protein
MNEKTEKQYAANHWTPTDIVARFAVSQADAEAFLQENERRIVEGMVEGGWQVIDDLADLRHWQRTDEDEDDAYERAEVAQ